MTTQILFIRHGETDWNRIKRIQGHVDIPLSEHGFLQAEQLGQRLAREGRMDAVYSSDLQRAQQTARPFADALGLELRLSEGLRERFYGAFQGHDSDEINDRFPAEMSNGRRATRVSRRPATATRSACSITASCTRWSRSSRRIRAGASRSSRMAGCSI